MIKKLICLIVVWAQLNTASGTGGPTLILRDTAEGMIVEAIRYYAGHKQSDLTAVIQGATPLGVRLFKLRFQECGEVTFIHLGNGKVFGVAGGRGYTQECQVTNWDVAWSVLPASW